MILTILKEKALASVAFFPKTEQSKVIQALVGVGQVHLTVAKHWSALVGDASFAQGLKRLTLTLDT